MSWVAARAYLTSPISVAEPSVVCARLITRSRPFDRSTIDRPVEVLARQRESVPFIPPPNDHHRRQVGYRRPLSFFHCRGSDLDKRRKYIVNDAALACFDLDGDSHAIRDWDLFSIRVSVS